MKQVSLQSHSTLHHVELQAPNFRRDHVGCCSVLRCLDVLPSPAQVVPSEVLLHRHASQCMRCVRDRLPRIAVEPTAQRQFQYLCRWFGATARATLRQRGSQSDQLDDHSLATLAFGSMGRCHRGLVGGGHSYVGANVARALPPRRRCYFVGTDGRAIADRPGHAGAAGHRHECSATLRLFRAGHPCATRNSADVCFGRNKACWPPLAVLASGSTAKVRAPQVMSWLANGCHHLSGEVSSWACGRVVHSTAQKPVSLQRVDLPPQSGAAGAERQRQRDTSLRSSPLFRWSEATYLRRIGSVVVSHLKAICPPCSCAPVSLRDAFPRSLRYRSTA